MGRVDFVRGMFFLLLLLPTPGFGQFSGSSMVSLTGTVYSEGNNEPVARASLTLCDDGGASLQQITGNDSGEFSFNGIRPGRYLLRLQAGGHEPAELRVDLSFGSQRGFSVTMKPVRAAASPTLAGTAQISAHELAMPEEARRLVDSGRRKLFGQKDAAGALRDFQAATAQAPAYYEAHYLTGMAHLSLQNPSEAERQFRKSVELSQRKYADADIALGTILLEHNEANEGEPLLRQGLAIHPQSWPGQFALGEMELSRGHLEPALAAAEKAESLAPQQPVVYRLLALIHIQEKDYPALLTDLDNYIQLDPDSPAGLRAKELRAETQRRLGQSPAPAASASK